MVLQDSKYQAMISFSNIMTMNQDAFTNSIYSSRFNSKKRLLEEEIAKLEKIAEEKNIALTREYYFYL